MTKFGLLVKLPPHPTELPPRSLPASQKSWEEEGWGEDVTGSADTASLLAELGALTFTKCVDYKPTDEAAALCGFDAPQATVTILYLNDTGTEGTLTLTFGSENLDQTGYYVRMEGDSTIYQIDTASVDTILSVAENGLTAADATGE